MEELTNKILNYFNKNKDDCKLEVLDNKYKKYYTGVTLNYITYDLLKAKYRKSNVAEVLLNLHKNGEIHSLYCGDIENIVFESKKSEHWNFNPKTGVHQYKSNNNLHEYLKKFIKND